MSLPNAQYTSTTPAFMLTATPATGVAFPTSDPYSGGQRPLAAFLQADTQNIRFTTDGSAPTSSVGILLVAGAAPFFYAGPLGNLRFIQTTAGSKLNVVYINDPTLYVNLTIAAFTQIMATAALNAASLTLSGDLAAVNGAFSGTLSSAALAATTGTFTGKILAPVVAVNQNSAPADGTLVAGQCATWFDQTNGAGKVMFKGKTANGTVATGSVSLT